MATKEIDSIVKALYYDDIEFVIATCADICRHLLLGRESSIIDVDFRLRRCGYMVQWYVTFSFLCAMFETNYGMSLFYKWSFYTATNCLSINGINGPDSLKFLRQLWFAVFVVSFLMLKIIRRMFSYLFKYHFRIRNRQINDKKIVLHKSVHPYILRMRNDHYSFLLILWSVITR